MDEDRGPELWQDTEATILTFLCSVAYDDLPASFAGLLHRECCAEALLVLPQTLAFFETVLLHDLVGHCTTENSMEENKTLKNAFTFQIKMFKYTT